MRKQHIWENALACLGLIAITGIASVVIAEEKKEIPDHSGFEACQPCHAEKHSMWEESSHSKAISAVSKSNMASADCYGCHSTEGFTTKREGKKIDVADKGKFHTISCLACHNPRGAEHPRKLVMDPEKLCEFCHTQRAVLKGQGAKGIEDTRSFHSGVSCVSCHMSEGNHRMKVIRPDDPKLPGDRTDTCTACHKDGNREARAKQIREWQSWYKESMDPLQADLKTIDAALKEKPGILNAELKARLDALRANVSMIVRDGSEGAHNLDFALEIMAQANKDLKEIRKSLGTPASK
jgi:predicted CXXCH cytochrome family protein